LERPCATILNLLGFVTTVSLMAKTHCMMDGLTLVCLTPLAPEPSLATRANRPFMAYQTMQWYVICYQWFKQGLTTERL